MDYEKKYKEALVNMQELYISMKYMSSTDAPLHTTTALERAFPELKELGDEEMRKGIISNLDNMIAYIEDAEGSPKEKKFIINEIKKQKTWLENQGKSKFEQCIQKGDKIVSNEDGTHFNVSQLERVATKESKFKAGDWVITDKGDTVQIGAVNNGYYTLYNGMDFNMSYVDKCWHRWTIEDAKDGDVLHSIGWHNDCIFIFNGLDNWRFDEPNGDRAVATGYCCLFVSADKIEFGIQGPDCIEVDSVKPATKEQCDLLFAKMKEAGYEWNAEKKELKKVEQEPAWSEEDEENLNQLHKLIVKKAYEEYEIDTEDETLWGKHAILDNWLKSLKERIKGK